MPGVPMLDRQTAAAEAFKITDSDLLTLGRRSGLPGCFLDNDHVLFNDTHRGRMIEMDRPDYYRFCLSKQQPKPLTED